MKKYFFLIAAIISIHFADAQDNISPAKAFDGTIIIKNGNVHTGTGTVLQHTDVKIVNGKIEAIGEKLSSSDPLKTMITDATGMEV